MTKEETSKEFELQIQNEREKPTNELVLKTEVDENYIEDLLNRTAFVNQVIKIIKRFSDNKKYIF